MSDADIQRDERSVSKRNRVKLVGGRPIGRLATVAAAIVHTIYGALECPAVTISSVGGHRATVQQKRTDLPTALGRLAGVRATMDLDVSVERIDPDPIVPLAWAEISDPFEFTEWTSDDTLEIQSVLSSGMSLPAGVDQASAERTIRYTTDIPGMELLYELVFGATNESGAPEQHIRFTSHSSLGLIDADVEAAIASAFSLDSANGIYTLDEDLTIFDGLVDIPADVSDFAVAIHDSARATLLAESGPLVPTDSVIVSPIAVFEFGLGTEFGAPAENMINQSGFVEPFVSGETAFDEFIDSGLLINGRAENIWSSRLLPNGEPNGELVFDFGEIQTMDRLAVWNATLKDVGLSVADSAEGPWEEVGDFTLEEKLGTESAYGADVLEFGQAYDARYVRVDVRSLYRPDEFSAWFAVVNEVAASVLLSQTAFLPGDYNGNGVVEQADLDLALLNWGTEIADLAAVGWVNDLPSGAVDQQELDKVLLNWGQTSAAASAGFTSAAAGVPEPTTSVLAMVVVLCSVRKLSGRFFSRTGDSGMLDRSTQLALVGLFLGVACSAQAQLFDDVWAPAWEWTDVDASVRFTGVGLGDVSEQIEPPAGFGLESLVFDERIMGSADFVLPSGALNHGVWDVSQETMLTDTGLSTSMMQMVQTSTDGGAVGAFLDSRLDIALQVNSPFVITLEGTTEGNPNPGSSNFARVLLRQGNQTLFKSPGGDFTFEQALEPGDTYTLQTRVAGESNLSTTTVSAALLSAEIILIGTIKSFDVYDDALYVAYTDPEGPGLSILRPGQPLENYRLQASGTTVNSQVDVGQDGFVVVSTDVNDPQHVTASFFGCGCSRCICPAGFSGSVAFQPLDSGEVILPQTQVLLGRGDGTFQSVDALISPRDPVSGQPTGERFVAALVEMDGQPALIDWQWGEDGTHTTIDEPRVTLLGVIEPNVTTKLEFIDGPRDRTVGAFASESGVTLIDFGSAFTSVDPLPPGFELEPNQLGTLNAGGVPFAPDTLRAGTSASGMPMFSIQQGNKLLLYEYNGMSLEMTAEQALPAGATGFWSNHAGGANLIQSYIYQIDDELYLGRLGEAVRLTACLGDVDDTQLDASTPPDTPTSHVSLAGNAVVTVDSSYIAPPGRERIEAIAAKDAVLRLNGDMDAGDMPYVATGNRAAVVATGTVVGDVVSHGREVARTILLSNPPVNLPSDPFDDAFAHAAIEAVNPAASVQLTMGTGQDGDAPGDHYALVVTDSPSGTQRATVEIGFQLPFDPITLPFQPSSVIETIDGNGTVLRATAAQRDDPYLAFNYLAAAVTPDSYLIASNDANTPAALGLAQAAAKALGHPLGQLEVLSWENLHLQADADNPTMQAEFISGIATEPNGETNTLVSVESFVGWDETVSGSDEGAMLVELGIVTDNADPDSLETVAAISGSPAEVADALAGQFYTLPEKEDEVLVVFLRYELTAPPQGTAWFNNAAGLIQLLPALLEGDYNGNGTVEQRDLDLALLNWGTEVADLAAVGWINDLPSGPIDQQELDRVLLNWGHTAEGNVAGASGVPEPTAWVLAVLAIVGSLQPLKRHAAVNRQHGAGRVS